MTGPRFHAQRRGAPYSRDPRPVGEKSARVLEVIREHIALHGYPPSLREIQDAAGISSTSVVSYHLGRLEQAGLVERDENKTRALRVVEAVA